MKPARTVKAPKLDERDLAKQVIDFLKFRGWRKFRNTVGTATGAAGNTFSFGEKGMPDLRFVKYFKEPHGACVNVWIETKKPGWVEKCHCKPLSTNKCRNCSQRKWRTDERLMGAIVLLVNDFDEFMTYYEENFSYLHSGSMPGQGRLF